jgi:GntR family transcriptional regulator, transcriptional repressor for pyruvate dehydrogenase complex
MTTQAPGERRAWQGIAPIDRRLRSDLVMEQILSLVRAHRLEPGDRLPTEQELVALTGAGRATVREAIRSLASLGLVETGAGRGTFLRATEQSGNDHTMLPLLGSAQVLRDLVEARLLLDPAIARLAAVRVTAEDIAPLREALARLRHPATDTQVRQRDHVALHLAIVQAANNRFFTRLWSSFATFMRESPLVAERTRAREGTFALHEAVVEAIAHGDADVAEAAMRRHMQDTAAMLDDAATAS